MARSGRFGKYGDLKRKEKIRRNRLVGSDRAASLFASARKRIPKTHDSGAHKK